MIQNLDFISKEIQIIIKTHPIFKLHSDQRETTGVLNYLKNDAYNPDCNFIQGHSI